jgi:zinc transport system substrate-binding protein
MFATALLLQLLTGCGLSSSDETSGGAATARSTPLNVVTLSVPVDWLVQRLGGDLVERSLILPEGADASTWEPGAEQTAALAKADLVVMNGAGYEAWVATAALPESRLVDTSQGLALLTIEGPTHAHGASEAHDHTGTDPHTWLDPDAFRGMAKVVHYALASGDPSHKTTYDSNLEVLLTDLQDLAGETGAALALLREQPLFANHPSYGYLARRFGLRLTVIDLDPQAAPPAAAVDALKAATLDKKAAVFFWEEEPGSATRGALPPALHQVRLDPLEHAPAGAAYDYLAQARANAATVRKLAKRLNSEEVELGNSRPAPTVMPGREVGPRKPPIGPRATTAGTKDAPTPGQRGANIPATGG